MLLDRADSPALARRKIDVLIGLIQLHANEKWIVSKVFVFLQVKNSAGILELPCDVLIPAALESQIHSGNARNIKVSTESLPEIFIHNCLSDVDRAY